MRFILAASVIIMGLHIGTYMVKQVNSMQDAKMDRLCQIDSSYCK
jgi:hypothetical protein